MAPQATVVLDGPSMVRLTAVCLIRPTGERAGLDIVGRSGAVWQGRTNAPIGRPHRAGGYVITRVAEGGTWTFAIRPVRAEIEAGRLTAEVLEAA